MATAATQANAIPGTRLPVEWTVADLQLFLGNVPSERIRLFPPPGMATIDDVLALDDRQNRLCELVDGILVEKVMGSYESLLAGLILTELNLYLRTNPIGVALGADGMLRILPDRVRIPDVSVIAWERFPDGQLPRDRVFQVAPDLAVEVLSEDNTEQEMKRKLDEYFSANVRVVWYVDPSARTVDVYAAPDQLHRLSETDVLEGGDVLRGFKLPLQDLFGRFNQ